MHTKLASTVVTITTFIFSVAPAATAANSLPEPRQVSDQVNVIIGYFDEPDELDVEDIEELGGTVKYVYHLIPAIAATVPASALSELEEDPQVERFESDLVYHANPAVTPDDPQFPDLWGLNNTGQTGGTPDADIDAPEAWAITTGSSSTIIAVVDTGAQVGPGFSGSVGTHPDLAGNLWVNPDEVPGNGIDDDGNGFVDDIHGWNFLDNASWLFFSEAEDDHGTHVAGTIGAQGNNGIGVTGVTWDAQVMILKFLGPSGGFTSDAIMAIQYATDEGARVINASWGGGGFSLALKSAIEACGCLFVAAAGNSNVDTDSSAHYPSSYDSPNLVAVAATDHNDQKASFSNYGATTVDLGAPGLSIISTLPMSTYGAFSGTSMAAPHVSGAAALVYSQSPSLTAVQVKDQVLGSVDPIPALSGITVTGGRLNVANALGPPPSPPLAPSGLTATAVSSSQVDLAWTDNSINETGFEIERRQGGGAYALIVTTPADQTTFNDSGLADSTTYTYRVRAVNSGGTSDYSTEASATTPAPPPPPPPPGPSILLQPTDGWDEKNLKTLVEDGKLSEVLVSDDNWVEVEDSFFMSFRFEPLATSATISAVKIGVEHHAENGFQPSTGLTWEVGGGSLQNPATTASTTPNLQRGEQNEALAVWDVTTWVNTLSAIDDLKFVVRNNSSNGKKTKIDHVYVEVVFATAETTPPETTITLGPPALSNSADVSFSFTSDEAGSSFQCSLDGGVYGSCISPQAYNGLADGAHGFLVRATDQASNTDPTPASWDWTIDTAAPAAPLISTPGEGALLTISTVTVSGTSEANAVISIREGVSEIGVATASATGSWSTAIVFADGAYTIFATATDAAGNTSVLSASRSFTVDTTAPETTITLGPPPLSNSADVSFSFTSDKAGSSFQCSLDGGVYGGCTSPQAYNGLADGAHGFLVRATDQASNTDPTPASWDWTIDTAAPAAPLISTPGEGALLTISTVTVSGTSEANAVISIREGVSEIGVATASATGSWSTAIVFVDGAHTIFATATDAAGNPSVSSASRSFTIDTTAPETTITSGPPPLSNSADVSFSFTSDESGSSFECSLDGGVYGVCTSPQAYNGLADGVHDFLVRATDQASNTDPTPAGWNWTIDTAVPAAPLISAPAQGVLLTTSTVTVSGTSEANAVISIRQGVSEIGVATASATGSWSTAIVFVDGAHTIFATATDAAGNPSVSSASRSFTIDTTAPPPSGLVLYLHNGASPPTGGTTAQADMPMDATMPTVAELYEYSTDYYSGAAGRWVEKSNSPSATETDTKYMANWRYQSSSHLAANGAELRIFVAMKDLQCDKTPSLTFFLIAGETTLTGIATSPSTGSEPCDFREVVVTFGAFNLASGEVLELKAMVNEETGDAALFAYDTTVHESRLALK